MEAFLGFRLRRGFTLIELLIVILIIGILASLTVSIVNIAKKKAALARATAMVRAIGDGLDLYKSDKGSLPGRGSPADPEDFESNVIADVVAALRAGNYARISERDFGIVVDPGQPPVPATKEQVEDSDQLKVVVDPWGWSYIARENESKEKKEDWMHNKDGMDVYSMGPNMTDDTIPMVEGPSNDDIGNW
jgi:prepilin-type N-terminal cleavage/methylation domain-containing protein